MSKKRKTPSAPRAHNSEPGYFTGRDEVTEIKAAPKTLVEWAITPPPAPRHNDSELLDETYEPEIEISASTSAESEENDDPETVSERRLTSTLLRIFTRRRLQIRLSMEQLSRLSGISLAQLAILEHPKPGQTISYEHAVVLARALGIPSDEMPGLRRRDQRAHLSVTLSDLERTMMAAPLLRFEGRHGERYGGDVERAAASKAFTVRVEDDSLAPAFARGSLLAFVSGTRPRVGGTLLLRHLRSALLALRRFEPPAYTGIATWQPGYVAGGEWHVVGCLEAMLPPR